MTFIIPGEPRGKGRPRFAGHAYTDQATRAYEDKIRWEYKAAGGNSIAGPVEVKIMAYHAVPKSASKAKAGQMLEGAILPTKKPDADNIAKAILDGLNGLAYMDDKQVVSLAVDKQYDQVGYVQVSIREVEGAKA